MPRYRFGYRLVTVGYVYRYTPRLYALWFAFTRGLPAATRAGLAVCHTYHVYDTTPAAVTVVLLRTGCRTVAGSGYLCLRITFTHCSSQFYYLPLVHLPGLIPPVPRSLPFLYHLGSHVTFVCGLPVCTVVWFACTPLPHGYILRILHLYLLPRLLVYGSAHAAQLFAVTLVAGSVGLVAVRLLPFATPVCIHATLPVYHRHGSVYVVACTFTFTALPATIPCSCYWFPILPFTPRILPDYAVVLHYTVTVYCGCYPRHTYHTPHGYHLHARHLPVTVVHARTVAVTGSGWFVVVPVGLVRTRLRTVWFVRLPHGYLPFLPRVLHTFGCYTLPVLGLCRCVLRCPTHGLVTCVYGWFVCLPRIYAVIRLRFFLRTTFGYVLCTFGSRVLPFTLHVTTLDTTYCLLRGYGSTVPTPLPTLRFTVYARTAVWFTLRTRTLRVWFTFTRGCSAVTRTAHTARGYGLRSAARLHTGYVTTTTGCGYYALLPHLRLPAVTRGTLPFTAVLVGSTFILRLRAHTVLVAATYGWLHWFVYVYIYAVPLPGYTLYMVRLRTVTWILVPHARSHILRFAVYTFTFSSHARFFWFTFPPLTHAPVLRLVCCSSRLQVLPYRLPLPFTHYTHTAPHWLHTHLWFTRLVTHLHFHIRLHTRIAAVAHTVLLRWLPFPRFRNLTHRYGSATRLHILFACAHTTRLRLPTLPRSRGSAVTLVPGLPVPRIRLPWLRFTFKFVLVTRMPQRCRTHTAPHAAGSYTVHRAFYAAHTAHRSAARCGCGLLPFYTPHTAHRDALRFMPTTFACHLPPPRHARIYVLTWFLRVFLPVVTVHTTVYVRFRRLDSCCRSGLRFTIFTTLRAHGCLPRSGCAHYAFTAVAVRFCVGSPHTFTHGCIYRVTHTYAHLRTHRGSTVLGSPHHSYLCGSTVPLPRWFTYRLLVWFTAHVYSSVTHTFFTRSAVTRTRLPTTFWLVGSLLPLPFVFRITVYLRGSACLPHGCRLPQFTTTYTAPVTTRIPVTRTHTLHTFWILPVWLPLPRVTRLPVYAVRTVTVPGSATVLYGCAFTCPFNGSCRGSPALPVVFTTTSRIPTVTFWFFTRFCYAFCYGCSY